MNDSPTHKENHVIIPNLYKFHSKEIQFHNCCSLSKVSK